MAYLVIKLLLQGSIQQRLKILVIVPHGNLKGIVHGNSILYWLLEIILTEYCTCFGQFGTSRG